MVIPRGEGEGVWVEGVEKGKKEAIMNKRDAMAVVFMMP